jgi:hypothetical protein
VEHNSKNSEQLRKCLDEKDLYLFLDWTSELVYGKLYLITEHINTKLATCNVVPTEAFAKVVESYDALRRPQSRLIKHVAKLSEHTGDQKKLCGAPTRSQKFVWPHRSTMESVTVLHRQHRFQGLRSPPPDNLITNEYKTAVSSGPAGHTLVNHSDSSFHADTTTRTSNMLTRPPAPSLQRAAPPPPRPTTPLLPPDSL